MFHNQCRDHHEITAPPLVCARSGYLHTICSDVTQRKGFITTPQTVVSRYSAELSHRQDRPRCCPDDSCKSLTRKPTSFATRFHAESGSGTPSHDVRAHSSLDVATQHSRRSLSVDFSRLKWDSQTVRLTTPSGSQ